ncbi:anaerobic ribonucleoside-triphosphate reductase activating protein [candidate division WOR-3 bacterium JGI_Cruoil_03_44_89]|uniref:Anaerobic ribonucleoside-triphosphate reductase activating protein n=1 Tax=candidate division WOR-3 bacterium JGI_Cruoil_03_44_89 TaxID=1973748 RepID=A0A235C0B6_UNCW3|nr:MAG: anaerobic ribonucleoside-triphosphate reductase activating protein [candidate division WOR-3 bacterium JGI_Cruoil_03_44_89]
MIKGLQRVSIVDFPKRICVVVFTGGCNFRCPYCHNPELVVGWEKLPTIRNAEVVSFLESRRGLLDGVCITGGEPTIHKRLPDFIERVKEKGFEVKLDTNGTNPAMVGELIKNGLLDYIAMDVKATPQKYDLATGVSVNIKDIKKSIKVIMNGGIDYEFRTTVFPDFLSIEDANKIGEWLKGASKYVFQRPRKLKMLQDVFKDSPVYAETELNKIKNILSDYVEEVTIR